jgi:hypothetical protein
MGRLLKIIAGIPLWDVLFYILFDIASARDS